MFDQQMELGIENAKLCPSIVRREQRAKRARWWFDRMRQIVGEAIEHRPAPEPRPEQIWFTAAHRNVGETSQQTALPNPQERQICE
jgi:hypothetical protein